MPERFVFQVEAHGEGGFGKVFKGRDTLLDRDIAVKVLDPLMTRFGEAERERFKREARILASLSHPNIPAIYDVSFDERHLLIVFEFIEGKTLEWLITQEGPIPLADAKRWFSQLASALSHAHENGIVHRDIKPANVIITPNREAAYLVDFGIALSMEEAERLTDSGYVMGTRGYMSPEQAAGESVDFRTDIYSLGVTLYEALAGRRLAPGRYEGLASINEAIPPEIDGLILECLESDRDRRLPSLKTFVARLTGALTPSKPLSEVLAHGRLHELSNALEVMTADQFLRLPEGQRRLILVKVSDLVQREDTTLQYAAEQLLRLLVTRGVLLAEDDYRDIVKPALEWGFERAFGDRLGRDSLRRAVEEAAGSAPPKAHEVLCEEFGSFLSEVDLETMQDWYLHSVREVLTTLLANPNCENGGARLADLLTEVNRIRRSRQRRRPPEEEADAPPVRSSARAERA